jgi:hypothetical protein
VLNGFCESLCWVGTNVREDWLNYLKRNRRQDGSIPNYISLRYTHTFFCTATDSLNKDVCPILNDQPINLRCDGYGVVGV